MTGAGHRRRIGTLTAGPADCPPTSQHPVGDDDVAEDRDRPPTAPAPSVPPRTEEPDGHGRDAQDHGDGCRVEVRSGDRKSTRLNSSHANISYAVFCLK